MTTERIYPHLEVPSAPVLKVVDTKKNEGDLLHKLRKSHRNLLKVKQFEGVQMEDLIISSEQELMLILGLRAKLQREQSEKTIKMWSKLNKIIS